jgi:hypothetical protein
MITFRILINMNIVHLYLCVHFVHYDTIIYYDIYSYKTINVYLIAIFKYIKIYF